MPKYYNKMPFPVNFRKIWTSDNEKVTLASGGIIEGPPEYLSQYSFLSPLPIEFHLVESETQGTNFDFKDKLIDPNKTYINVISNTTQKNVEVQPEIEQNIDNNLTCASPQQISGMPFDPMTVNWLGVKITELEQAAMHLNINIDHIKNMKPKDKKWKLVNLIKSAINKE